MDSPQVQQAAQVPAKTVNLGNISAFICKVMETFPEEAFVRNYSVECDTSTFSIGGSVTTKRTTRYTLDLFMPKYGIAFDFDNQGDAKTMDRQKFLNKQLDDVLFIPVYFTQSETHSKPIGLAFTRIKSILQIPCPGAKRLAELEKRNEELSMALYVSAGLSLDAKSEKPYSSMMSLD